MEKKRICVTGGAGFLGSNLCRRLLKDGNIVICVDNLYTGNMDNIRDLMTDPDFCFLEHDITEPMDLRCDRIYNLACPASPVRYGRDPVYTTKVSFNGALNVLELAKSCGATVLQASTSEIYGDPKCHPQTEDYRGSVNPTGPRACYSEGKRVAETLFFDHHRLYGVKIKVARIFNTYGPGMDEADGRVVSDFIVRALRGEDIQVNGDGNQTRSFCYVDDMIEGLMLLMDSREDFTGPVNIGNPSEFAIKDLAKKVIEMTGSKSRIVHRELPQDDPARRRPDISLARKELSWEPGTTLDKGLEETIRYFKEKQLH